MLGELLRFALSFGTGSLSGVPFRDFAANCVGCFVMGLIFCVRDRMLRSTWLFFRVETREAVLFGLSSGFCGCLTTFSGWSQSASDAILDKNVSLWFIVWFVGFAGCIIAFRGGEHLGAALVGKREPALIQVPTTTKPSIMCMPLFLMVFIVSLFVTLIATVGGSAADVLLPALVAPVGGCARCAIVCLNVRCLRFPYGTFAVNICGTALLAVLVGVYRRQLGLEKPFDVDVGERWDNITYALLPISGVGFCGSFTTVSTLIVELLTMKQRRVAYIYGVASIVAGQAVGTGISALFRFT